VEVKIGVRDVAREVTLESELTAEEVQAAVDAAVGSGSLLKLTDDRGRVVMIPGGLVGYVEIGAPERGKVGFGAI
jgi:hypothetical protein